MKSLKVSEDIHQRLMWYKVTFNFATVNDVLEYIMDKLGLATVDDIKRAEFFRREH